jgi:hypothetical protein
MHECFGFRNFRQFERTRREIKLPYDLLNDIRFRQLPDARKAHLICLLLLSARMNNLLPNSPAKLERLIGATEPLDLSAFADFVDFNAVEKLSWQDRVANRRVPDSMRAAVLVRDGGRCRKCSRAIKLEMDHIIPVSKGGKTEESGSIYLTQSGDGGINRNEAGSSGMRLSLFCRTRADQPGRGRTDRQVLTKLSQLRFFAGHGLAWTVTGARRAESAIATLIASVFTAAFASVPRTATLPVDGRIQVARRMSGHTEGQQANQCHEHQRFHLSCPQDARTLIARH